MSKLSWKLKGFEVCLLGLPPYRKCRLTVHDTDSSLFPPYFLMVGRKVKFVSGPNNFEGIVANITYSAAVRGKEMAVQVRLELFSLLSLPTGIEDWKIILAHVEDKNDANN